MQLNCTYSNYTEAAACSAAQQHSTFAVQIVYKVYSLQLNCTYGNYTEAPVTCTAARHSNIQVISSEVECSQLFGIVCVCEQSREEIRYVKFMLWAGSTVLQFSQWQGTSGCYKDNRLTKSAN